MLTTINRPSGWMLTCDIAGVGGASVSIGHNIRVFSETQAKCLVTIILPKAVGAAFLAIFTNFDKCVPEVAGGVISNVAEN